MRKSANALAPVTPAPLSAPPAVNKVLQSPGRPLDSGARSYFEPRFGSDFSRVRIHTDAEAAESAQSVDAQAYTVGSHIVFGQGHYQPGTSSGRYLLAHELAHTLQTPDAGPVLRPLRIAPVDDPSERAADHAASAVLRGESTSLFPTSAPMLRRQFAARTCTADPPAADTPHVTKVHCSDKSDYRVNLILTPNPPSPDTQVTVNAGFNESRLYVRIDICHGGTEIVLTPSSGDLSQPVATALGNILANSPALQNVTANPDFKITIMQDKSFTLTITPTLTVGQQGVTGGGASVGVQTQQGTISLGGTYSAPTKAFNFTISFSPGQPTKTKQCTKDSEPTVAFTCERITHTVIPAVPQQTVDDEEVRYLFFYYPSARIRENFHLPTKEDMQKLSADGFKVTAIDGYTSPEGPKGTKNMPQFEGNDALGQERATAAHDWLAAKYPEFDLTNVPVNGHSELPPGVGADPEDKEGKKMERAAVSEFLGEAPGSKADPLAPKDPAEVAAFKRLPESKQRDKAFELLRRAAIRFKRTRITQQAQPAKPGPDKSDPTNCEKDVTDAARRVFNINVVNSLPNIK